MELQQSLLYISYIKKLGWHTREIDGSTIIYRYFPLYGGLAKLQRPSKLPPPDALNKLLREKRIRRITVEPDVTISQETFDEWRKTLPAVRGSPFLPTKTILVDLTVSEKEIFKRFSEAKRRGVRRAGKNHVTIQESHDIEALIKIKSKSAGLFGSITTYGIRELWSIFSPEHASILLSQHGGVLLIFWQDCAYYWIAGATKKGKKLFTPTLLVWEALKLSKRRGMKKFDFVGVWDERLPRGNDSWKGFTKFKEGFGGKSMYYPLP
ncbi:peptidoglycan bridge formation glycyltransferase FemA/FemB family protein [Candidatus Gottesmanbacteria bacterium]|nr:peptidoglycan bridge formation glycyltransferase FemA/FemB family protein [Candidatus Gottesmanbacteria bacterium]